MKLTDYIRNPEQLDAVAVEQLGQLVERYPYFQAARLLLLRGLYQLQDDRFGPALRAAAIYVPDRTKLFQLIEGYKFQLQPESRNKHVQVKAEPSMDRTQSLIESFLAQQAEQPARPKVVDASTDYMAYLEQLDDLPVADDQPVADEPSAAIIDHFMENTGGRITLPKEQTEPSVEAPQEEHAEPEPTVTQAPTSETDENAQPDDYFTETLARIYVKQGKYNKAIEIIRRINLNYPKKSTYFADQIRFLEKLALNESFRKDPSEPIQKRKQT